MLASGVLGCAAIRGRGAIRRARGRIHAGILAWPGAVVAGAVVTLGAPALTPGVFDNDGTRA